MGHYTAEKQFTTEFDGDVITYTLRSPDVKMMKKVAPLLLKNSNGTVGLVESVEMMEQFGSEVIASTVNFSGCVDASGIQLPIEKVCSEIYFLVLVSEMISNLFSMGGMSKDEEKKLESLSSTKLTKAQEVQKDPIAQLVAEQLEDTTQTSPIATIGTVQDFPGLNGQTGSPT